MARGGREQRDRTKSQPRGTTRSKGKQMSGSLRTSDSFRDFVLDQLSEIAGLGDRVMFGGVGLYAGDVFFALVAADVLYFKVDDRTRPEYERAGSGPFRPYAGEAVMSSYYNVPVSVLEHAPTLLVWARRAIDVARANTKASRRR